MRGSPGGRRRAAAVGASVTTSSSVATCTRAAGPRAASGSSLTLRRRRRLGGCSVSVRIRIDGGSCSGFSVLGGISASFFVFYSRGEKMHIP